MSFTSFAFILFLPIVFFAYWILQSHLRLQNLLLVVASYVFYSWWNVRFLLLIIITSLSSYASALLINRIPQKGKLILGLTILVNFGILACFKYYNFFAENFHDLMERVGLQVSLPVLSVILPVGISFYTFQSMGYILDVYRGKVKPATDLIAFLAFISFFPQLVAGPIERATSLLPQMLNKRSFDRNGAVDGMRQVLWGFFKKMVIADTCAMCVNQVWISWHDATGTMLLIGAILFSFQIYCDFSGYSDIAIGVSKLFGIRLCDNFLYPYFSRNMSEFWRRWHMSLMTWFRDYVYIPLGGNRKGKVRTYVNNFITMVVAGLWHGASWMFVIWGAIHGGALVIHKFCKKLFLDKINDTPLVKFCSWLLTTLTVMAAWVFFRAKDMATAGDVFNRMFTDFDWAYLPPFATVRTMWLVFAVLALTIHWGMKESWNESIKEKMTNAHWIVKLIVFAVTVQLVINFSQDSVQPLLYAQF